MSESSHFPVFILVSLIAFIFIINFVMRERTQVASVFQISLIALIVVVGGMFFAKYGENTGLHWSIYYGVPVLLTLVLPPVAFRMDRKETTIYLIIAFLVSPAIHVLFSFFLGWKEYMPFIPVPSLSELLKLR
jgi:hypothetical protein